MCHRQTGCLPFPLTQWDASHYAALLVSTQAELLLEIEGFLRPRKMAETTFGRLAVNDGKFVGRLRSGANMTLATIAKARGFITEQTATDAA